MMAEHASDAQSRENSSEPHEEAVPFTGTVTSYAQQFEDVMLWRALRHVGKGFYIDVGAWDPVIDSVSLLFYERGWRGIHVEASRELARKLRLARPDELVIEAVVSDKSGGKISFSEAEINGMAVGLSTADKESRRIIESYGVATHSYDVQKINIDDVYKEADGQEIHWLKIDVEGFEKKVIRGWTSRCRPWIVVLESITPLENKPNYKEWEPALKKLGYSFVWSDFANRYYIHENHHELRASFRDAPNYQDSFILHRHSWMCNYIEAERVLAVEQRFDAVIQRDDAFLQRDVALSKSNNLSAENARLTADLHALRSRSDALAENIARLEAERDRLGEDGRSLALALRRADSERAVFAEKLADESSKYARLTADFHAVRGRADALTENILRLEAERSGLVEEERALAVALKAAEIENERLSAVNAAASGKNMQLATKLDAVRESNKALIGSIAQLEEEQGRLSVERQALTHARNESKAENTRLLDELDGVRGRNDSLSRQNTRLTTELVGAQERVAEILKTNEMRNISLSAAWKSAAEIHSTLRTNFQAVSEQFSAIRSSTIWRMTAPVRRALNCVKRICRWFLPVSGVLWLRNTVKKWFPRTFDFLRNNASAKKLYRRLVHGKMKSGVPPLSSDGFPEKIDGLLYEAGISEFASYSPVNSTPMPVASSGLALPALSQANLRTLEFFESFPAGKFRPAGERVLYYYIDHTAATGGISGIPQVARRIAVELALRGEKLRFVKWLPSEKKIAYCDAEDMRRFTINGTVPVPGMGNEELPVGIVDAEDIYPGDWFVSPECTGITVHDQDPTNDLFDAVEKLKLKSAFVFYDATPLKFARDSVIQEPAHAGYMRSLIRADIVFSISRHVADDLFNFLRVHENIPIGMVPHIVVLPGLGHNAPAIMPRMELASKTILSVGSVLPHKNQVALLKAFVRAKENGDLSGWKLRLAGSIHPILQDEVFAFAKQNTDIEILGSISDVELDEAYRHCAFTVFPSLLEGFGIPIVESLGYGKPCICADFGAMAEVAAKGGCLTVNTADVNELARAIVRLADDHALREELSREARTVKRSTWRDCADVIAQAMTKEDDVLAKLTPVYFCVMSETDSGTMSGYKPTRILSQKEFYNEFINLRPAQQLFDSLAGVPESAMSTALPHGEKRKPRIYLDVTDTVISDSASGIQRVARNIVYELYRQKMDIEPWAVALGENGRLNTVNDWLARNEFLPEWRWGDHNGPVDFQPGDVYLQLDLLADRISKYDQLFAEMRQSGVRIVFIVYDILGIRHPEWFVSHWSQPLWDGMPLLPHWLFCVSENADGIVAISCAARDDVREWIAANNPKRLNRITFSYFHLGTDAKGFDDIHSVNAACTVPDSPYLLMVGTIEIRKNHALALDAMEILWRRGVDLALCVVGKEGWLAEAAIQRLRKADNKHLWYFGQVADVDLNLLYKNAKGMLFVSAGEGFGLPITEAANHGTSVVCSDIPVFHEIAGKFASYVRIADAGSLADDIEAWWRAAQQGKAPDSAKMPRLTWAQSARALLDNEGIK